MKRIPRPRHSTLTNIQSLNNPINIQTLYITYYINNNFSLFNRSLSFDQFSNLTYIPKEHITNHILNSDNSFINLSDNDSINRASGEIFQRSLAQILEINSVLKARTSGLIAYEGGTYKPFVTTAVTAAIDGMLRGAGVLANLTSNLRAYKTEQVQTPTQNNYLTIDKAMLLLKEQDLRLGMPSPADSPGTKSLPKHEDLWDIHSLSDTPEVVAKPATSDGIRSHQKELQDPDPYQKEAISRNLGI